MSIQPAHNGRHELAEIIQLERRAFAAKVRMARAVIGWSQSELALHVGLTQRSVHKLEQGETEPRRATVGAIEMIWRDQGIEFENLPDGGFRVSIRAAVLAGATTAPERRRRAARVRLGAAAISERSPAHRA